MISKAMETIQLHSCFRLIEHLNEQLKLWEKSLKEIPDAFTNAITKHRYSNVY